MSRRRVPTVSFYRFVAGRVRTGYWGEAAEPCGEFTPLLRLSSRHRMVVGKSMQVKR